VAILLVVLYHAGLGTHGGFTGVDVFFVISGFVIAGTLLRELEATDRVALGRFYARRVRRLLPAFALMVVAVSLAGILAAPAAAQRMSALTALFASAFSANVYLGHLAAGYFGVSSTLDPFLHTWTLAVEEQFYLVFPAVLLGSWALARRLGADRSQARLAAAAAIAVVALVSGVLAWGMSRGAGGSFTGSQTFTFYSSPTRAWEFAAGALVALAAPWLAAVPRALAALVGACGLGAVLAGGLAIDAGSRFPVVAAGVPVAGAVAIVAAGSVSERGAASRLLRSPPLTFVGDVSYSWYLWHWPLIVFTAALWPSASHSGVYAALVALLFAWLSFRNVENPVRRGTRFGRGAFALAAGCLGASALAGAVLLGASAGLRNTAQTMKVWAAERAPHADVVRHCDSTLPLGPATPAACTWRVVNPRGTVVLVGDSNAGHFTEPVTTAARRAGFDATVVTHHACPFADVLIAGGVAPEAECRRFFTGTLAALVRRHPTLVVVAQRTDAYLDTGTWSLALPDGGGLTSAPAKKAAVLERGLARAVDRLGRAGIRTVIVHPVPQVPAPGAGCAVLLVLTHGCAGSVSRTVADRELEPALRLEDAVAAHAPRSGVLSVEGILCARICSSVRGRTLVYTDPEHLSVPGSELLAPVFYRYLSRVVAPAKRSSRS